MCDSAMKWLALLSLIVANLVKEPTPVIRVQNGLLRGRISDNGRMYQYFGIPYGTVDDTNRFQAPLPPRNWDGIYEADIENTRCPQKMFGPVMAGAPDCLKLNVYTPVGSHHKLPVMVFLHGGCFYEGTGTAFLYGPDLIVENNVIFVGVNYRLNVEGFLCLGIKEAPGNAGLKDQIAALTWIKRNIATFGGDPDNVTLFGESAGAVSVSYQILSPASRGLFHKAILQSGSTLAPWGLQHDPIKASSNLAKKFGYDGKDPHEIYKVLSKKSVTEILAAIEHEKGKTLITAEPLFTPCVEAQIDGVTPVITDYPTNIIHSGNYSKIPMILGYNDLEGIYFVSADYGNSLKRKPTLDVLKDDLEFPSESVKNATVKEIYEYYFSSEKEDLIMDMVNLYSDLHFKFPAVIESELYSKTNDQPMYYYLFKYSGLINLPKYISQFVFTEGASHADELFYLFTPHTFPMPTRYLETRMIQRMVTLWTNFAKYGDPTPTVSNILPVKWKPSRARNPRALVIDRELTTAPWWDERSVSLWNNTYTKYRRKKYGFS